MKRIAGVVVLLAAMYAALYWSNANAFNATNLLDIANRQGFYGILTVAAAVLILSGSIDLSLGSVVALGAVGFALLIDGGVHPYPALALVVVGGAGVGLVHGLLVHGLKLQSFLVTLCGMFVWRGVARVLTGGREVGLQQVTQGNESFRQPIASLQYVLVGKGAAGEDVFPAMLVVFGLIAVGFGAVLHFTVHGRYWLALGYSQAAARYAGVPVGRYRVASFVLASALGALAGVMLLLYYGSAKPDNAGQSLELEAITGAVLGGVSLRGGEGTIVGMALGAAVLPLLQTLVTFLGVPNEVIPVVIGLTLLIGSVTDEWIRRRGVGRK